MGCRQHCASPPRAESLTCRSSSHLLLWFESNGSHRHRRVTLLHLAESRLRRFQQNPAQWLRSAASERRGFHSRGKPLGRRFEQNYRLCLRSAAGEKRGFRPRGEPSPHASSHRSTCLQSGLSRIMLPAFISRRATTVAFTREASPGPSFIPLHRQRRTAFDHTRLVQHHHLRCAIARDTVTREPSRRYSTVTSQSTYVHRVTTPTPHD